MGSWIQYIPSAYAYMCCLKAQIIGRRQLTRNDVIPEVSITPVIAHKASSTLNLSHHQNVLRPDVREEGDIICEHHSWKSMSQ